MRFFIDPSPFTHHARFYGFPCYFKADKQDCPILAGTNVVWDWCILHVAPRIHTLCEFVLWMAQGADYEPHGFRLEILGEIEE